MGLDAAMRVRWLSVLGLFVVGGLAGALATIASVEINRHTSTEAFCTSCHSMAGLANDRHYVASAHRSNAEGVRPSCGDCHIPKTNWFAETYTHVASGVRDVWAELTNNFSDPKIWDLRRVALAHEVRDLMRRQDSITCRSCHAAADIRPTSERGQAAHSLMREGRMTCIDCHFNLVHAPVPPTMEFIRGSGLGAQTK
jgi:nitrate/TMAO reductase-like tetraheme cytochrome c subunit